MAEWTLSPTNVAFLRVQTGVFDPAIVGDKSKWYSHQLDTLHFKVWNDANSALLSAFTEATLNSGIGGFSRTTEAITSEDSSRSGSDVSTSSSYSSLSDFVGEMINSEISGDMPAHQLEASKAHVLSDPKSICHPPDTLQFATAPETSTSAASSTLDKTSSQQSSAVSSSQSSSQSASPSGLDEAEEGEAEEEVTVAAEEKLPIKQAAKPEEIPIRPFRKSDSESTADPRKSPLPLTRSSTPLKGRSLDSRPLSAEPSVDNKSGSGTSSPTLSRTISITSVFSRTGSLAGINAPGSTHSGSGSSGSFLERFTSEAKEAAREAKAVTVAASKTAFEATKKEVGKQKIIKDLQKDLQSLKQPVKEQAREFWRQSQEESSSHTDSSAASIMSSVSSDFNGLADKTSSMFSGLFSGKGAAAGFAEKVKEKAQPFGTRFPAGKRIKNLRPALSNLKRNTGQERKKEGKKEILGNKVFLFGLMEALCLSHTARKGLAEKSSLIRHSTTSSQRKPNEGTKAQSDSRTTHRYARLIAFFFLATLAKIVRLLNSARSNTLVFPFYVHSCVTL